MCESVKADDLRDVLASVSPITLVVTQKYDIGMSAYSNRWTESRSEAVPRGPASVQSSRIIPSVNVSTFNIDHHGINSILR